MKPTKTTKPKIEKQNKRDAILYVRVTPENKDFIEAKANEKGMSESIFTDALISLYRKEGRKL
jgi:hypothetical protein